MKGEQLTMRLLVPQPLERAVGRRGGRTAVILVFRWWKRAPAQAMSVHLVFVQQLLRAPMASFRPKREYAELSALLLSEHVHQLNVCDQEALLNSCVIQYEACALCTLVHTR